jgi:hypothetical protein
MDVALCCCCTRRHLHPIMTSLSGPGRLDLAPDDSVCAVQVAEARG